MKFANKVALITGGTSGIGLAAAECLAKEGASVVISGRNRMKGEAAIKKLKEIHSEVMYLSADVSKSNEIKLMVNRTVSTFGKLDFAYNNACNAEVKPGMIHELSEEDFDQLMGVTIRSVWLCMKYELQAMLASGNGSIVNTASLDALLGSAGVSAYAAGKSGIITLTKCAAQEYGRQGIRINTVTPGAIRTPMLESKFDGLSEIEAKKLEGQYKNLNALGKIGTAKEAAAAVSWLMSDEAAFITGQNIIVDGGVSFIS